MAARTADPIKILVATGLYPPDIGGPATHVRFLESVLPERGFLLTVMPFTPVRRYPKLVRHVVYLWRLWRQSRGADIVYALDPVSVGVPAWLISRIRRRPFVLRLGGDYAWEQGQQRFGLTVTLDDYTKNPRAASLLVQLLAHLEHFIARRAVLVILPSKYLRNIVATWGVDRARLVVIYSVLYPLPVVADKATVRTELGLSGTVLVTAGRLVPWKGVSTLITLLRDLRATDPSFNLVVVGDGPERACLEAQVIALELANAVRFTGALDKTALARYKQAADVFVLNTAYEGLSHELLEAMDIGVPIVTTAVGGNLELITDRVSGKLVAFNDKAALKAAIVELSSNQELTARMVAAAKVRTRDFAQETLAGEIAAALNAVYLQP